MSKSDADLVYVAPPSNARRAVRRVYVLPRDLVKRIHRYGFENGHPSEVSAVRDLLEAGLKAFEVQLRYRGPIETPPILAERERQP